MFDKKIIEDVKRADFKTYDGVLPEYEDEESDYTCFGLKFKPSTIYSTPRYELFTRIVGNRKDELIRAPKLCKSIETLGYVGSFPITVCASPDKRSLQVIDGQGRAAACEMLKLPIQFVVVPNTEGIKSIIEINNSSKAWKLSDYLQAHSECGPNTNDYIKLREIISHNKYLRVSTIASVLYDNKVLNTESILPVLREGDFTVNVDLVEAEKTIASLNKCSRQFCLTRTHGDVRFIQAVLLWLVQQTSNKKSDLHVDMERMYTQLIKHGYQPMIVTTFIGAAEYLDTVYNSKRRILTPISFQFRAQNPNLKPPTYR